MMYETICGYMAAVGMGILLIPQVGHVMHRVDASGTPYLFLVMQYMISINFIIYGNAIQSGPLIVANALNLTATTIVLFYKIMFPIKYVVHEIELHPINLKCDTPPNLDTTPPDIEAPTPPIQSQTHEYSTEDRTSPVANNLQLTGNETSYKNPSNNPFQSNRSKPIEVPEFDESRTIRKQRPSFGETFFKYCTSPVQTFRAVSILPYTGNPYPNSPPRAVLRLGPKDGDDSYEESIVFSIGEPRPFHRQNKGNRGSTGSNAFSVDIGGESSLMSVESYESGESGGTRNSYERPDTEVRNMEMVITTPRGTKMNIGNDRYRAHLFKK